MLAGGLYGVWVRNASSRFTGTRLTTLGAALDGSQLVTIALNPAVAGMF